MCLTALAPAKVNLCLHVGGPRADGYHPIASLVAFADIGDGIRIERAERLSLTVTGPFGAGLGGQDNLILTALRALGQATGIGDPTIAVTLDKQLPVAAGLGGGSSDAATALRLTRDLLALDIDEAGLAAVAGRIGADGPMCLSARTAWAEGIGDRITLVAGLPPLAAVLANPGVLSPTGSVYAAYDRDVIGRSDRPGLPDDLSTAGLARWLSDCRNDLERPAVTLNPVIGETIAAMAGAAGNRLSRMSGSGATVFGLFDGPEAARAAAEQLSTDHGDWWVRACVLGDSAAKLTK